MSTRAATALPRWAVRTLALLLGTILGLIGLVAVLLWRLSDRAAPFDAELRRQAVREMASSNAGLFDSHPDPELGRLLTAEMRGFEHHGQQIDTNRFGLREREYEIPKRPGVVRIVLLGDSMIFGMLAKAEDRLGVFLEHYLQTEAGKSDRSPRIEVLHVGIPSWNIRNQSIFLRRQLSLLAPDLVLHVVVPNDIEDDYGVRGFGAPATFSPQRRQRADGRLHSNVPYDLLPEARPSLLRLGLDFESRSRYDAMRRDIGNLAHHLDRAQIPYRTLFHYRRLSPIVWQEVGRLLEQDLGVETYYTSIEFGTDPALAAAPNDPHWNRRGHELMAQVFYAMIQSQSLLPELALASLPEASDAFENIAKVGRDEATKTGKAERMRARQSGDVRSQIDFAEIDAQEASQVYGGIDAEAQLMPFASLILRGGGASLQVKMEPLARPELADAHIQVLVDGVWAGKAELGGPIDLRLPIPESSLQEPFLNIAFEASDFVYAGEDLRQCRVARLLRIAVE